MHETRKIPDVPIALARVEGARAPIRRGDEEDEVAATG